jgi:hypothetical protein
LCYTKYMSYCCRSLAETREYQTDELIPYIVQSQELSRRIVDTFSYDDPSFGEVRGEFLVILTSDSFKRDLHYLQNDIPSSLLKNSKKLSPLMELSPLYQLLTWKIALLDLEFHVIRITINEAALHEEFWTVAEDAHQVSNPTSPSAVRTKMLWCSLNSCKDFIRTFLSYGNEDLFYLTAFIYPRLCYVFITLARLVTLDSNSGAMSGLDQSDTRNFRSHSWSAMNVAKEAEFQELGKQVLEKFTAIATNFLGADGERDVMSNLASAMRLLMVGYEQQINEIENASRNAEVSAPTVEMAREQTHAAIGSTTYSTAQGTENGGSSSAFDMAFTWDSSANTVWDDILENFTIIPMT